MKLFRRYTAVLVTALLLSTAAFGQHPPRFDTIRERLETRDYPSVFSPWAGVGWTGVFNLPQFNDEKIISLHDLFFTHNWAGVSWGYVEETNTIELNGNWFRAEQAQNRFQSRNPNMEWLAEIRMYDDSGRNEGAPPVNLSYWIHDADAKRVPSGWPGHFLIDFAHPDTQDIIVEQARNAQDSGLFDGIMFDWWHEDRSILKNYRTNDEEQAARDNILQRIRDVTHPDFLILVNTNQRRIPRTAQYINGAFMETGAPREGYTTRQLYDITNTLRWADKAYREPRLVCLEARSYAGSNLDSPAQLQWMRFFTTMSLTYTERGFVLYALRPSHSHNWYEFWNADLGQPVSPPLQTYRGITSCFIREFTNGWAVLNRSGDSQWIEFDVPVAGVSSEKFDYIHELPHFDGEIYLKSSPTGVVAPHDKLPLLWGNIKNQQ